MSTEFKLVELEQSEEHSHPVRFQDSIPGLSLVLIQAALAFNRFSSRFSDVPLS